MKMPILRKRKKLQAATAARRSRALGLPDEMDYEEMSEPNMKLSRALLIVLVLHVVAVAGIIAFNTIKTREASEPLRVDAAPSGSTPSVGNGENAVSLPNELTQVAAKSGSKTSAKTSATAKPSESKSAESPKASAKKSSIADSGKIYTVAKGDNPVTIARHLHVNYDALLELNQITDPRKLQIGQKLHLPERETPGKPRSD